MLAEHVALWRLRMHAAMGTRSPFRSAAALKIHANETYGMRGVRKRDAHAARQP